MENLEENCETCSFKEEDSDKGFYPYCYIKGRKIDKPIKCEDYNFNGYP